MGSLEVKALAPSYPPGGKKNNKSNGERSDDAVEPPPSEYIINPRDRIGSSSYLDLGRVGCLVRCERRKGGGITTGFSPHFVHKNELHLVKHGIFPAKEATI